MIINQRKIYYHENKKDHFSNDNRAICFSTE